MNKMKRSRRSILGMLFALPVVMAACSQSSSTNSPVSSTSPDASASPASSTSPATGASDLLAKVKQQGKLLISTDANYKPQSFKNSDGSWEGFDVEVGKELAKRLGVQPQFLDIDFDVITAGKWNGRWDINIGSMTVTAEREKLLLFTQPYYYTPASFVLNKDSQVTSIDGLAGKRVGLGSATTYQSYLEGKLTLAGEKILKPAPKVDIKIYNNDQAALQDLALGNGTRLDAVLTALPTAEGAIKDRRPFKILGKPVYYEAIAVDLDRNSPLDSKSLQAKLNQIIGDMHKDGTLTALSKKFYGIDLTKQQ